MRWLDGICAGAGPGGSVYCCTCHETCTPGSPSPVPATTSARQAAAGQRRPCAPLLVREAAKCCAGHESYTTGSRAPAAAAPSWPGGRRNDCLKSHAIHWSGNKKKSRSSTSCGYFFLGGSWVHAYLRTRKNITLSSAESEYVALVLPVTQRKVQLVVHGDNSSSIAAAQREGVG